jgi:RimJ/RimL family protein N-acetyltransferase
MHRILDMPADGGYGMRRCQWTTTSLNLASQNAAKRLGYQYEGVLRAQWICPPGKEGVRRESPSTQSRYE